MDIIRREVSIPMTADVVARMHRDASLELSDEDVLDVIDRGRRGR